MKKEMKFESALERLEEIVASLESGTTDLDDSIKLFEEGMQLVKFCSMKLDEVKKKVEILVKKGDGEIVKEDFNREKDEAAENNEPAEKKTSKKGGNKTNTDELF